jgi:gliding motility-associated-like protein
MLLACCFIQSIQAQTTLWFEDFSGVNQGWTPTFTDCDGQPQSFSGVRNGRFEVQDEEGAPCCGSGGANGNIWETNDIDISGYCNVTISFKYGSSSNLECAAGGPYFMCQGPPAIDNGHDQMVFYYSYDAGMTWTQFKYVCGNVTGAGNMAVDSVTCLSGTSLRIRIMPANKAIDELYWFDNVKVTGTPGFTLDPPSDVTVCANQNVMTTLTGGPAGATYTWTNDNPAIGLAASGTTSGNINFPAAAVATQQIGNITVTPHMGPCCSGTPVTYSVTVNPLPTVVLPANITVCADAMVTATFGGTGTTFNWTNSNPNIGLPATGDGDIGYTAPLVNSTQTGTITVTPGDANNCTGPAKTFTITINPLPTVSQPANITACGGGMVTANFSGTGGTTFSWTNDNTSIGLMASGTGNIGFPSAAVANQEIATIVVTPHNANCTGNPLTFTITLNPTPTVDVIPNQVVCGSGQIMVSFNGTNNPNFMWTSSNPAVGLPSTGNGDINTPASNVATTQVSTVTVTPVSGGCTGTAHSFTVTVTPSPNMNQPANVSVCTGAMVNVSFSGTNGALYNWVNDNTSIGLMASGTGNIGFPSAAVGTQQVANITVTPQVGNCMGPSLSFTITINPLPTVNVPANQSLCAGDAINIPITGTGNPTFSWTNSNINTGLMASGTGNILGTAAQVASTQISTITITPNSPGCNGTPKTFTLTVSPLPSANAPANVTACAGQMASATFTGTTGAIFSWTNSNPAIGLPASGTGNISFPAAAVATQQVATVTVTPKVGNCSGTPVTFTITVNPAPVVNPVTNIVVCGGQGVMVHFTGTAGSTFSWTNSNTAINLPASGTGDLNFNSAPVGATTIATITVTPSGNACPGIAQTFTITVQNPPTANVPANQTVCSGAQVVVGFTGTGNPVFNWTNSNPAIGLPASGSGDLNFPAASVISSTVATITVTPTAGTCNGTAQTFTVTVNPAPSINPPSNVTVCSGQSVPVNFTGTAGATFSWTNSNPAIGLPASGTGNLNFTTLSVPTTQIATLSVTPQQGNCNGTPSTFSITVNPTSTVNPNPDLSACGGQTLSATFTGNAASYSWTNSNPAIGLMASGNGDFMFNTPAVASNETGTIIVTPAAGANGCPGIPDTFLISVVTTPIVNSPADTVFCSGTQVMISLTGTAGTTVTWTNSNPAIGLMASGNGSLSFQAPVNAAQLTAIITATPHLGTCTGTPIQFKIIINPTPTMTIPGDLAACPGNSIQVNFDGTPMGVTFKWTNNNPAIGLMASGNGNLIFSALNPGLTPISGLVSVQPVLGSCTGPAQTFNITINPQPSVVLPPNQTICAGQADTIHFTGVPNPTINWTNNNPAIGLGASGTGDIQFTATGGAGALTGSISVTPVENGCTGLVKTFFITVAPAPTATAPADTVICSGQPLSVHFSGSSSAGFSWTNDNTTTGLAASGNGDISFTSAFLATQQVSTVSVTPKVGTCTGPPVVFTITVKTTPMANPVSDLTVCGGDTVSVAFSGTPGTTFDWSNDNPVIGLGLTGTGNIQFNTTNPPAGAMASIVVTPSAGGCAGIPDTFKITVPTPPLMNQPADQIFCSGNDISINFTGPAGTTYNWLNSSDSIGLATSGSGNIHFTAANVFGSQVAIFAVTPSFGGCPGNPLSFSVTVNPAPGMTPPVDVTACAGAQASMTFSGGPAGVIYHWTNSNPAIGLGPTGTGDINFTASGTTTVQTATISVSPEAGGCTGPALTAGITINPLPTVDPLPNQTVCANGPVALSFTGSANTVFSWTNSNPAIGLGAIGTGNLGFTAANATSSQTGILVVTPTSGACKGVSEAFDITVTPLPVVNNPGNQSVCGNGNVSINFTGASGSTFSWTNSNPAIGLPANGSGNLVYTAANPATPQTATIVITPKNGSCTGIPATFTITVNPLPVVTITGNQKICTGGSATLTAAGGAAYNWSNAQTGAAITVSPAVNTNYTVTVSSAAGCSSTGSASVTIHQPSAILLQKTSCNPADTGIVLQTLVNQFGCDSIVTTHTALLPSNVVNLMQTTCDPNAAGTFSQTLQNHFGCDSTTITHIIYDPAQCAAIASVVSTGTSCSASVDGSAVVTVTSGGGPFQYNWTDGAGNSGSGQITALNTPTTISSLGSGTFSITITPTIGLPVVLTGNIPAPAPLLAQTQAASGSGSYALPCYGRSDGVAQAQATGGNQPYQFTWSSGAVTSQASNLQAGTYTVTVTDKKGCTAISNVTLNAPAPLQLSISITHPNCGDLTVTALVTPGGGVGPYAISADTAAGVGSSFLLESGSHLIRVTDNNGCRTDTTVLVSIPSATTVTLPADTLINLGETLTLEALTNLTIWKSISWQPVPDTSCPACLKQTWVPIQDGSYTIVVTDTFGCSAQATTRVHVKNQSGVYIPNAFSPDGDGVNDLFVIGASPAIASLDEVRIFDRWGNLLYSWTTPVSPADWPGWDGTYKGQRMGLGVYVYYVKVKRLNGQTDILSGDITVAKW